MQNKKFLAMMIVLLIVIVGVVFTVVRNQELKKTEKSDTGIETEKDKNATLENSDKDEDNTLVDSNKDELYDEIGLEIKDETDGKVDSVDGSGSWEDTFDNNIQTDSNKSEGTENNEEKKENADNLSDRDVLEDDKVWSDIN